MASCAPPASMMRSVASMISGPMPSPRAIVIGVLSGIASLTFRGVRPTARSRWTVRHLARDLGAKLKPTPLRRWVSATPLLAGLGRHSPGAGIQWRLENGRRSHRRCTWWPRGALYGTVVTRAARRAVGRERMDAVAADALYQRIVDNARTATGARLVHFAWYEPATGM